MCTVLCLTGRGLRGTESAVHGDRREPYRQDRADPSEHR